MTDDWQYSILNLTYHTDKCCSMKVQKSGVDTDFFGHCYIIFMHTNLGVLKFNFQ